MRRSKSRDLSEGGRPRTSASRASISVGISGSKLLGYCVSRRELATVALTGAAAGFQTGLP
jgi:hypothetical protein